MNQSQDDRDLLAELAEEFANRRRLGETPSLSEYSGRYPHLAREIRELFPALDVLEQFKPTTGARTADFGVRTAATIEPGLEQLGDYRIVREIGRGGMGVVYEAEQLSLGRRVAIKVLPRRPLGDVALSSFLREARAAAGLHHSNIVPVFGAGEDCGLHYYVMQHIIGLGLDQVLDELRRIEQRDTIAKAPTQGPNSATAWNVAQLLMSGAVSAPSARSAPATVTVRPESSVSDSTATVTSAAMTANDETRGVYWRSVARIGKQAADALDHAHAAGILHRDIKPSNLILDDKGTVWVTDFGLAKATEGDDPLTHAGDIVGTLRYMAPERFQGRSDVRGDVFSLGLTLYEMLTLEPAYQARDRESLLEQLRIAQPPRPRKLRRSIPPDLETIVLKATEREPARRYQTATELADDLQRYLDDRPIRARRTSATEHLWRWAKRNPMVATLTSCVALLLVTIAVGASVMNWLFIDERNAAKTNETRALIAEKATQENLWTAYLAQLHGLRVAKQPGYRSKGLDVVKKAAAIKASLALRNEAANLLLADDVSVVREWENSDGDFRYCGADKLGRLFCRTNTHGDLSIRGLHDQQEVLRLPGWGPRVIDTTFSLSGNLLAAKYQNNRDNADDCFVLWDLRSREKLLERKEVHRDGFIFSPDERWLAFMTPPNDLMLFDIPAKTVAAKIKAPSTVATFGFDPAGKRLAIHYPAVIEVRSFPGLTVQARLPSQQTAHLAPGPVSWSRDGSLLATCEGNVIVLRDGADPTKQLAVLEGHEARITYCLFNSQGDWLLTTSWDGKTRFWDLLNRRCAVTATGTGVSISPDDRYVGYTSGNRLGVWEFHVGRDFRRWPMPSGSSLWEGSLSPDGQWYAITAGRRLEIYEMSTGKLAGATSAPAESATRGVHFTSDGAAIIASHPNGVMRWAIRQAGPGALTLDPPQTILQQRTHHGGGLLARDARHLACVGAADRISWHDLQTGRDVHVWNDHHLASVLALSVDDRWLATGAWQGFGVKIRDTRSGALVHELPVGMSTNPRFSPNGEWLATASTDGVRLWNLADWKLRHTFERRSIGNWAAQAIFSPDSKYLAFDASPSAIRILDPAKGEELLTIETVPSKNVLFVNCLTANADTLVGGVPGQVFGCWDLRSLRRQLRDFNLDWDDP